MRRPPRVAEQAEFDRQVRRYCLLFAMLPGLTDVGASAKVCDSNGSHFLFLSVSSLPFQNISDQNRFRYGGIKIAPVSWTASARDRKALTFSVLV